MNNDLENKQLLNITDFVNSFSNLLLETIKRNNFDVNDLTKIMFEQKEKLIENTGLVFQSLLVQKDIIVFDPGKIVWRIITMGNYRSISQLIEALDTKTSIVNYIKTIILNSDITLEPQEKRYRLSTATLSELVGNQFENNGFKYEQLMEVINITNNNLCPVETAIQLLLQDQDIFRHNLLPVCRPFLESKIFCLIAGELRVVDVKNDWSTISKISNLKVVYLV